MSLRDAKRALAMMISAAWTKEMRAKLWAEATTTAALLGNVLPNTRSTVPPDKQFYGEKSNISNLEGLATQETRSTQFGEFRHQYSFPDLC
jgi:hypothetical protein